MTIRFPLQVLCAAALCFSAAQSLSAQEPSTPKETASPAAKPVTDQPATAQPAEAKPTKSKATKPKATKPKAPVSSGQVAPPSSRRKSGLKPVALNSATRNEIGFMLKIDGALADKIVAGRPYHTKAELVTKGIISMEQYSTLKDKVAVH